jgi:pantothenate kinase type III
MDPTLILHVGNSRMKWGLYGPRGWLAQGVIPNSEIGTLALRDWQNLARPARAIGVNASGEAARVRVESQLARWRVAIHWLVAPD